MSGKGVTDEMWMVTKPFEGNCHGETILAREEDKNKISIKSHSKLESASRDHHTPMFGLANYLYVITIENTVVLTLQFNKVLEIQEENGPKKSKLTQNLGNPAPTFPLQRQLHPSPSPVL